MLNRHTLRIKALQTLYAVRQAESANYQLALDSIAETLSPNLNTMVQQNLKRLEGLRQLAIMTFEEKAGQRAKNEEEIPPEARRVAIDAFDFYQKRNQQDRQSLVSKSLEETERIHDQYLMVLLLLIELGDEALLADQRRTTSDTTEIAPVTPFGHNGIIEALRQFAPLQTTAIRRHLAWSDDDRQTLIRPYFREMLRTDEEVEAYCRKSSHSPADDAALILHVVKDLIFKNERWHSYFELRDLQWAENRDIVRSLSLKTIKGMESSGKIELQTLSPHWEDDRQFFQDLLRYALLNSVDYEQLVHEQVQNWELDRLALTDRLLLTLAMSELLNFPGIPVKVTLNEYIEIAKSYSTPKSGQFLNGILDVLSTKLKENGTLRKSGRGLIDNR